jgi:hypothetical protein
MSEKEARSIAEDQKSPASEAADEVDSGPSATNPEDERRPEPPGTAEGKDSKAGPGGTPTVPPSRGTTH